MKAHDASNVLLRCPAVRNSYIEKKGVIHLAEYAPGMRVIIRDEEWKVLKIETNVLRNQALHVLGISPLVKDREAVFLTDLEQIEVVDPADVRLVPDTSNNFIP